MNRASSARLSRETDPQPPLAAGLQGRIIWHDLVSKGPGADMTFFSHLMGWSYTIEHAENFVWKPGPGDYPLIVAKGEAHGGVLSAGRDEPAHWRAYVEVRDVDLCASKARRLGATICKPPFDIPGVGRGVLLSDPQAALICPFTTTHDYPPPRDQFIFDQLVSPNTAAARSFYQNLFGWPLTDGSDAGLKDDRTGWNQVEIVNAPHGQAGWRAQWIPYLAAPDLQETIVRASELGARRLDPPTSVAQAAPRALLISPAGAPFGLVGTGG